MPDTPRYVTLRTKLYVQVLDLGPVQNCEPAKTMATCADSTSAATVALALNMAQEHDVDLMAMEITSLEDALFVLDDLCHEEVDDVTRSVIADARARRSSR